ncbi:VOC family protein [Mycobacterium hodleri]|uniref:VOC family protein n=1 Tax=Mycolicibacterium hodleri TaxID=49897 RepID=A0A544VU11_9MYCO|nr:VOC family protein [Mycolicibacterium hodleri]TQR83477.1 VOC family protein [Mycolicibacterium hodleri]
MIDHVYLSVSDPERALTFYLAALKPLGWEAFGKYDSENGPDTVPDLWGLSSQAGRNSIWLRQRTAGETGIYLGLVADDPSLVDAAYAEALRAGGRDDGIPAVRQYFSDGYYAANVVDLDDNRLEFVHKSWNQKPA